MSEEVLVPPEELVSERGVVMLGITFLALAALWAYILAAFLPVKSDGANWDSTVTLFGWSFQLAIEVRFIWLVIIGATLGSYVHAATSFVSFVGNRKLRKSWLWWYILRAPIGVCLALVFYFVVHSGLLSGQGSEKIVNPYGVAGLAGLVGMFSKQAADKLREVFDSLFSAKGDEARRDKLEPGTAHPPRT